MCHLYHRARVDAELSLIIDDEVVGSVLVQRQG
jgi:hypothetical protein